jgi:beta-phosphoglucomutase-like phosphatase (HAD superfamily)
MRIAAVVFDMDGVLIDAREWHYEALNRALGHFGYAISRFDHLVTYDGLPTRHKLEMVSRERGLPRSLHHFLNELKQVYTMEIVHARCKPTFQHEFALSRLHADGYKLAVASNSIQNTVDVMMDKADLTRYLSLRMSNERVAKGKPDPEIYTKTFAELGVDPTEVLVVEDNEKGIAAATAAGAHVVAVKEPRDVSYDRIRAEIAHLERDVTPEILTLHRLREIA